MGERPFDTDHNYFVVSNALFDSIMPSLTPNGWKVLCVAIRQTWGWKDETTETGRREWDQISYSQFKEKSGIGSYSTVQKALEECLKKGYLLRKPKRTVTGTNLPAFTYSLNREYEIPDTETVVDPDTETVVDPDTVSVKTKVKKQTKGKTVVDALLGHGVGGAIKKVQDHGPERCAAVLDYATEHDLGAGWIAHTLATGEPVPRAGDNGDGDRRRFVSDDICPKCWTRPCQCPVDAVEST